MHPCFSLVILDKDMLKILNTINFHTQLLFKVLLSCLWWSSHLYDGLVLFIVFFSPLLWSFYVYGGLFRLSCSCLDWSSPVFGSLLLLTIVFSCLPYSNNAYCGLFVFMMVFYHLMWSFPFYLIFLL